MIRCADDVCCPYPRRVDAVVLPSCWPGRVCARRAGGRSVATPRTRRWTESLGQEYRKPDIGFEFRRFPGHRGARLRALRKDVPVMPKSRPPHLEELRREAVQTVGSSQKESEVDDRSHRRAADGADCWPSVAAPLASGHGRGSRLDHAALRDDSFRTARGRLEAPVPQRVRGKGWGKRTSFWDLR